MAGRQPVRLLARQLRSKCSQQRRSFSSIPARLAAHNFMMPAMSPTMTEGNIASWKVKEGDSFSAGDILLEIETDKASMDVEAQDDGVMAKIFSADGSKSVKVGTRIAVIADPDDDVSSIELPADDSKPVSTPADNVKGGQDPSYETSGVEKEVEGTPQKKRPARDKPKSGLRGPGQNPRYPLYPSVQTLVHEHHLSDEDVSKIPATGPNRRLLKGDVLAYLGSIESQYPEKQSQRIQNLSHLDLSNIKIAKQDAEPPPPKEQAVEPAPPSVTSLSLQISLSPLLSVQKRIYDTLGVSLPLSTLLARAVDIANDDLPRAKSAPTQDDLFNAVLGLDGLPKTSRGTYLPQIHALPPPTTRNPGLSSSRRIKQPDIIDILSGHITASRAPPPRHRLPELVSKTGGSITTTAGAMNVFSLTVLMGEEKRARTFLERVKSVMEVEPGRLVL